MGGCNPQSLMSPIPSCKLCPLNDDSARAPNGGSDADPVLLGTAGVTDGVKEGVVSGGGSDVVILDSKLASPAHEAACARRLGYE